MALHFVLEELSTDCVLGSRARQSGPGLLCNSVSSNGPHSISSRIQYMGCTRQVAWERQDLSCTCLADDELESSLY